MFPVIEALKEARRMMGHSSTQATLDLQVNLLFHLTNA